MRPPQHRPPGTRPLVFEFSETVEASVEASWRALANTNRFNRLLGLDWEFEEVVRADGYVERMGKTHRFGQTLRWRERAFEVHAPTAFRIDRWFDNGPVLHVTAELALSEVSESVTQVGYRVGIWPRRAWLRPLIALDTVAQVGPSIRRAMAAIFAVLERKTDFAEAPVRRIASGTMATLRAYLAELSDQEVAQRLYGFLLDAPEALQVRMEPLKLAGDWGLPAQQVVSAFAQAVANGLLVVSWDVLCPSCVGTRVRLEDLAALPAEAHCSSCNVRFDSALPEALAVRFRPAPFLGVGEPPVRCVGSPGSSPHIRGAVEVDPDSFRSVTLSLKPGPYTVRFRSSLACAHLEVQEGAGPAVVAVDLLDDGVRPSVLRARAGTVTVRLRCRRKTPTRVVVEERWRPSTTLTLSMVARWAPALLPASIADATAEAPEVLAGVMLLEAFSREGLDMEAYAGALREGGAWGAFVSGRYLLGCWDGFGQTVVAARALDGERGLCGAVGFGPITQNAWRADGWPLGPALDELLQASRIALPGRWALSGPALDRPGVQPALEEDHAHWTAGPTLYELPDYLLEFPRSLQPSSTPAPGFEPLANAEGERIAARYQVGRRLGQGGFGVVHMGQDEAEGNAVVLKLLHPSIAEQPLLLQQFFNEAWACSQLAHPHCVRFLDFGHHVDGRLFLVMEQLEGDDLHVLLARGDRPTPRRLCGLAVQALKGLDAIHEAGLIHRDIKPANLFVGAADDHLTIIDFGIAMPRIDPDATEARTHNPGTPAYMSPEQFSGRDLDGRTDLYALGLVLYRALSGEVPHEASGAFGVALRRLSERAPPLREACAHPVPLALAEVVDRALEPDPNARFSSAVEMAAALEAALAMEPDNPAWTMSLGSNSPAPGGPGETDNTHEEVDTMPHRQAAGDSEDRGG